MRSEGDFAEECDSGAASEARLGSKRKGRPVSDNLPKATKKGRTFCVGESSQLKNRSVPEQIKILKDRVDRRIKNYKMADMLSGFCLMWNMLNTTVFKVYKPITDSLQQMKKWPPRSELENIKKKIKEIEEDYKAADLSKMKVKNKMKQASGLANMEPQDVSVEILREKLSSSFPWLFWEENATNYGPIADQDEGSLPMREQLRYYLENVLLLRDDSLVNESNFLGLKEAIENTTGAGWNMPAYLEPIASRIKQERGKDTELKFLYIQVLVCAAIKEMEELLLRSLKMLRCSSGLLRSSKLRMMVFK
ncbi:hypothetical protein PTKIN_Ptkin06aG0059300 [Pterospermum kingtungense]